MTITRRNFVTLSAAAGLGLLSEKTAGARLIPRARESLRILVLGGTGYIGPYQVRFAVERGHTVTLFNRGKSNPGLFPDLEQLRGDREASDLTALEGREWDAVIDNANARPRWTHESAQLLKSTAKQYLYTSSTGVYYPYNDVDIDEDAPVLDKDPEEPADGPSYGVRKVLSERAAQEAFDGRTTIVRPHLIAGPGDPTDRFTYWPARIDRGGEVMAPGVPTDSIQFIDVRDLTEWSIRLLEERITGVFNVVGPRSRMSVAGLLYGIRAITSSDVSFTWVSADFLAQHEVGGWTDLPVWIAPEGEYRGMDQINNRRAVANGLTFRPLAVTALDTLDWWKAQSEERRAAPRFGLAPEREVEVLAAWNAREDSQR